MSASYDSAGVTSRKKKLNHFFFCFVWKLVEFFSAVFFQLSVEIFFFFFWRFPENQLRKIAFFSAVHTCTIVVS